VTPLRHDVTLHLSPEPWGPAQRIRLHYAGSAAERVRGLRGVLGGPQPSEGMLFAVRPDEEAQMTMRGVPFPLLLVGLRPGRLTWGQSELPLGQYEVGTYRVAQPHAEVISLLRGHSLVAELHPELTARIDRALRRNECLVFAGALPSSP